ncbi:hypothetical protein [Luteococcus peritonei]|uniref:Ornithine cyclodeaminase family protein n=1 Tax=Luteococcus peritonei TaxID=88874 RepID=A0ABW4RUE9_9ACTN
MSRYLSTAQVDHLLPDPLTAIALAGEALVARSDGAAQVPPKPGLALGGEAFANAMPAAWLDRDLAGCKWVTLVPDNPSRGLPTAQGVMVLADATTGSTRAVMQAAPLTAQRTAAVTGACLQALADVSRPVAFLGTGAQARSHLPIFEAIGVREVRLFGRREEPLAELQEWVAQALPGLRLETTTDKRSAVSGAGAVVSGLTIGLHGAELEPDRLVEDVLLLPLDYASSVGAELARTTTMAADDIEQFRAVAPVKLAPDYPLAERWTGELLQQGRPGGRVLCQNLGIGITDLVFAAHVAEQAERSGLGVELPA